MSKAEETPPVGHFLVYNWKTRSPGLFLVLPVVNGHQLPPLVLHKPLPAVREHLGRVPERGRGLR